MFLYLIRHGEPDYETDTLTKAGIKQAKLLSKRLKSVKFDRIFTSPLGRAKQTAMPTCIRQNKKFEEMPWLSESIAYKAMSVSTEGKTNWWFAVQNNRILTPEDAKKYETEQTRTVYDSIISNFDSLLSELGYKKSANGYQITAENYNRIAFFCHDGISRILLSHALSIPFHIFCASFSVPHTGVTVLHFEKTSDNLTAPRCLIFSDLSHLYAGKLKNVYNNHYDI